MADEPQPDRREALAAWLTPRLAGADAVTITELDRPSGGYSAETILFHADVRRGAEVRPERFVLRLEVSEPAIYPQQAPGLDVEVEIQFRAMEALRQASELPLAPLLGYEPGLHVLGSPFFVMGFVGGEIPRENPPYTQEGFFAEARPDTRRRMLTDGLRCLAGVHAIDWRAAGLDWLVPPGTEPGAAAQLDLWERFAERELRGREHPVLAQAFAWLHEHLPPDSSIGVNWGDARPGNIIWDRGRAACLTDFENVSIGPPELDLGWWLMFDRCSHEVVGTERLEGEPTREEQREIYAGFAGRDLGDTHAFEVLAAVRYSAIVVRVMNRWVARGDLPEDQQIWLLNPASFCLADLQGVARPTPA